MQQTCTDGEWGFRSPAFSCNFCMTTSTQHAETTTNILGFLSLRRLLHHPVSWKCTEHQTLSMLFRVAPSRRLAPEFFASVKPRGLFPQNSRRLLKRLHLRPCDSDCHPELLREGGRESLTHLHANLEQAWEKGICARHLLTQSRWDTVPRHLVTTKFQSEWADLMFALANSPMTVVRTLRMHFP